MPWPICGGAGCAAMQSVLHVFVLRQTEPINVVKTDSPQALLPVGRGINADAVPGVQWLQRVRRSLMQTVGATSALLCPCDVQVLVWCVW